VTGATVVGVAVVAGAAVVAGSVVGAAAVPGDDDVAGAADAADVVCTAELDAAALVAGALDETTPAEAAVSDVSADSSPSSVHELPARATNTAQQVASRRWLGRGRSMASIMVLVPPCAEAPSSWLASVQ
jgi:hypothetical protein